MHVRTHVYMYMYAYMYMQEHVCVHVNTCMYMHACMYSVIPLREKYGMTLEYYRGNIACAAVQVQASWIEKLRTCMHMYMYFHVYVRVHV